jgi:uncharacterized membrane protein
MIYALAYISILVPFCLMDACWLSIMGSALYKPALGDILLPSVKIAPAVAFYLMYPIGLVIFAATPALKSGSVMAGIIYAAAFGAIAYGTYDLTNFATLRNWTMQITVLDMCWGAFISAAATTVSYFATRTIGVWLGVAGA